MNKNVALIVETSTNYGRDVLAGILRFMRIEDNWSVFLEQRDLSKKPPAWLESWQGDGIISRATTPRLAQAVKDTGVPFVDLTDRQDSDLSPVQIHNDDFAIGRLAAQHLLERGFSRFGFCGFQREAWSERRQAAFTGHLESQGKPVSSFSSRLTGSNRSPWDSERKRIAKWLNEIEKPFAVMACNDMRGQHVLDACRLADIKVPEEVAVVGVDNDELLCSFCSPPLSSVMANAEGVGFLAAQTLSKLMAKSTIAKKKAPEVTTVPPLAIAVRQSTDVVATEDKELAKALGFIRENACGRISVEDVVGSCQLSRSSLERKFRKLLGRTPQEEIRFVQVRRVKELLSVTDLPATKIAELAGFEHLEYLHVVFKRWTGQTMGQFRTSGSLK